MPTKNHGFTLIEVAILLVVVGLIAVGGLSVVGVVTDARRLEATASRMDLIEKALQSYVEVNSCLPCPADGGLASTDADAGLSEAGGAVVATSCTAAVCQTANAVVPWRTLGLSEEQAVDGWNDRIRYYIAMGTPAACTGAAGLQDTNGMNRCPAGYPAGGVRINDNDGVLMQTPDAAYVLVSNGPDQSIALKYRTGVNTGDRFTQIGGGGGQDLNTRLTGTFAGNDETFAYGDFIGSFTATHFDDIVRFKTAEIMVQLCGPGTCQNPN